MSGLRLARSAAFVVWALAVAGAVFWGLRVGAHRSALSIDAQPVSDSGALRGDISRLLGASQAPPAEASAVPGWVSRFKLIGVMAPKPHTASALDAAPGIALITLDGKPPRAYRVGSRIDGELMLRAVAQRSAQIGAADGSAAWMFELAPLPAPATGSLRNAGAAGMAPGREAPPLQPAPPGMSMMGMPPGQPAPQPMPPPEAPIPEAVGGVPGNDPSLRR